jgi:hypothetical protein
MKPFIGNSYFLTRKNKRDKHLKMTPLLSVTTKYYLLTCSLLLALLLALPLLHQRIRASVRLQPAKYVTTKYYLLTCSLLLALLLALLLLHQRIRASVRLQPAKYVTTKYYLLTCSLLLALLLVLPLLHQRIRASVRLQPAKYLVLLPPLSLALRPAVRDRTTCAELQLAAVGTLSDFADVAADGLPTQILLENATTI